MSTHNKISDSYEFNRKLALLELFDQKHSDFCNGEQHILIKVRYLPDSVDSLFSYLETLKALFQSQGFKTGESSICGYYLQVKNCKVEQVKSIVPAEFM